VRRLAWGGVHLGRYLHWSDGVMLTHGYIIFVELYWLYLCRCLWTKFLGGQ